MRTCVFGQGGAKGFVCHLGSRRRGPSGSRGPGLALRAILAFTACILACVATDVLPEV